MQNEKAAYIAPPTRVMIYCPHGLMHMKCTPNLSRRTQAMSISFGSIASGLPPDIVQQIMQAEQIPIQRMEDRKIRVMERQGLVDQLIGKVEGLRTTLNENSSARQMREFRVETREDIASVDVDSNVARAGTYQFEVERLAQRSSAMSSGFASRTDSYVGVGFIQYSLPNGDRKEIYVNRNNASLEGIARLINDDQDNGLTANIVNDGSGSDKPWRLILNLEDSGDENRANFPHFYFVDGEDDFFLEFERPAHDAVIKLNGFKLELPSNRTTELIPGVTINLNKASPGDEFTIQITEDIEAVTDRFEGIVSEINKVIDFIEGQKTMDENTDTTRTLGGDLILQTLESRIRAVVFQDIQTEFGTRRLGDLGVSFQRNGRLELDRQTFESKLSENYQMVEQVLTGQYQAGGTKINGALDNLRQFTDQVLQSPDGALRSRRRTLQNNIDQIDRRIEQRERILERREENLKNRFARLEGEMARIQSQSSGLAGFGGAGSPIDQLL